MPLVALRPDFAPGDEVEVWSKLWSKSQQRWVPASVVEVGDESVTVDFESEQAVRSAGGPPGLPIARVPIARVPEYLRRPCGGSGRTRAREEVLEQQRLRREKAHQARQEAAKATAEKAGLVEGIRVTVLEDFQSRSEDPQSWLKIWARRGEEGTVGKIEDLGEGTAGVVVANITFTRQMPNEREREVPLEVSSENFSKLQAKENNKYIIIFGNPGIGKSTLANALASETVFEAGVTHGDSLTEKMQEHKCSVGKFQGTIIVDLPGLDDPGVPEERARIANECSSALRRVAGSPCKIIFVCKLEGGRILPSDRVTVKLVLDAAPDIKSDYGVIFNKCQRGLMEYFADEVKKVRLISLFASRLPHVLRHGNVFFVGDDNYTWKMASSSGVAPTMDKALSDFIYNLPTVEMKTKNIHDVFYRDLEDVRRVLNRTQEEKDELKRQFEEAKQKMEELARQQAANFWFATAALPIILILLGPAVMTHFDIRSWGSWGFVLPLPGCHSLLLLWGIFPYYLLFFLHKLSDVFSTWFASSPKRPEDDFKVLGLKIRPPFLKICIKRRHVYLILQFYDAMNDMKTLMEIQSCAEWWIPPVWAITVIFSFLVPVGFAKGHISFPKALFYELVFEDVLQSLMSALLLLTWPRVEIPLPVMFSAAFSVLGFMTVLGKTDGWFHHDVRVADQTQRRTPLLDESS